MSLTLSEFSVAESEGVSDGLYGSRRDTFSVELECFNRLDVFNLDTINWYGTDDGSDYIEDSSLSSATSEDETVASVVSTEPFSDEESFVSRQMEMCCCCMVMHNRRCDDGLDLLSISSMSSCETQIVHRSPICNTSLNPPHAFSDSVEAAGPSVSMDVHSDKEASFIETTSVGVPPVDSVDNSAENHVSLRKKVNNRICSIFKRVWNVIKHPLVCRVTRVEPFVPPPDDTELENADSSCLSEPSDFKTDESDKFGYEMGIPAFFSTVNEETPSSESKQTEDVDCLDEDSLSRDTSDDDCGVTGCGPFSIQRRKPVHRLDEWSFNSANNHCICEGGHPNSLDLLSVSSDISSTEERSGTWQNGSIFKRAWNAIKHPLLCRKTRVNPFVSSPDDTESEDADSSCLSEPSDFKTTDDEGSLSTDTSEDDCGVIVCGPFSIQRRKPVHSFNSVNNHCVCEGGHHDLLSISSDISSTEERSGTWQNGSASETCACSDCRNMYATGPSMSLEEQSDKEAPSVDTVENITEKHINLRKKMKGISSFFKKTRKTLKWPSFGCCCCETRVEPFVPLQEDSEPEPEQADPKPHFVAEPFGFKTTHDLQQTMKWY